MILDKNEWIIAFLIGNITAGNFCIVMRFVVVIVLVNTFTQVSKIFNGTVHVFAKLGIKQIVIKH